MTSLLILPCFGLALLPIDLPRLMVHESVNSRDLALAVNYFVALGEERTAKRLEFLAADFLSDWNRANDPDNPKRTNFSLNSRVSWMCRILYEPKAKSPLRPPLFGSIHLPTHSMPSARWPIFPLVHSGETYFVLSDNYIIAGVPEPVVDYLKYCQTYGAFRKNPVAVPDRTQARKDFTLLRQSDEWKAIKWKDSGIGWSYTISEQWILENLKAQAEGIPEK
jgi:hypothetical protein